jgi:hypothetical protein
METRVTTFELAAGGRQRWPKERIRLSRETRIVQDSSERIEQRGAVAFTGAGIAAAVILMITLWGCVF